MTEKRLRDYANKQVVEAPDEVFWRVMYILSLYYQDEVMKRISNEQIEEVKKEIREYVKYKHIKE